MAARGILRDQNRQDEYDLISESVHAEESSTVDSIPVIPVISDDTTSEPAEKEAEPEILTQYASVYEQNPDLFGWICIENTVLDYPVMHTTDDPEKYLRLSFEGETSTAGTPFLDAKCGIDSDNYIIYGHNMKNGTSSRRIGKYDGIQTDIHFFCQQCNRFKSWVAAPEFNLNDGTDAHVQIICQCPLGKVPLCSGSTEGSSKRINWILHFNSPHI